MRDFGERVLGKGGVIAKDTPNFIGNRLGLLRRHAVGDLRLRERLRDRGGRRRDGAHDRAPQDGHLPPERHGRPGHRRRRRREPLRGRPRGRVARGTEAPSHPRRRCRRRTSSATRPARASTSATSGTADGLRRARTPRPSSTSRPRTPTFPSSARPESRETSARVCATWWRRPTRTATPATCRDTLLPYLAYASRRVPEISDTLEDVDHAMEWGFAHEAGPFRTWDLLGVRETVEGMDDLGIEVGAWVREMLDGGNESFYKTEDGRELQFSPVSKQYEPVREDPMVLSLDRMREEGGEISRNDSASLLDLGDGVLCLEFHSKGNSIDGDGRQDGLRGAAAARRRRTGSGSSSATRGATSASGRTSAEIAHAAQNGMLDEIGESVDALQGLLMGFRFAPKPVVAAPHGQTLGGGLEICLHADRVVAAGETYMGLVEAGVGLIPAGGGTKELARRTRLPRRCARPRTPRRSRSCKRPSRPSRWRRSPAAPSRRRDLALPGRRRPDSHERRPRPLRRQARDPGPRRRLQPPRERRQRLRLRQEHSAPRS